MFNTINRVDTETLKSSYSKRNVILKRYITDISFKSFKKLLDNDNLTSIMTNKPNLPLSYYEDTITAAVNMKFKSLQDVVNLGAKQPVTFTLVPQLEILNPNIDDLSKIYFKDGLKEDLQFVTAVTQQQTDIVSKITFSTLDFIKNKLSTFINSYSSAVQDAIDNIREEDVNDMNTYIIDHDYVHDVIIDNGVIRKDFSSNFNMTFDTSLYMGDLAELIKTIDFNKLDLMKINIEVDDAIKDFISNIDEETIEEFKEEITKAGIENLTLAGYINNYLKLYTSRVYEPTKLVLLWTLLASAYPSHKEAIGAVEKLIASTVTMLMRMEENKTIAFVKNNLKKDIYVLSRVYVKALEKRKDVLNAIAGYVLRNDTFTISENDVLRDADLYISVYSKYLDNKRYKSLINNLSNIRTAYLHGLYKVEEEIPSLLNTQANDVITIRTELRDLIVKYTASKKLDELLDSKVVISDIVKNYMFKHIVKMTMDNFELATKQFPQDEDRATMFAIILTLIDMVFGMFKIMVVDRVE